MALVYPNAERLGEEEGDPPAIPVYEGDEVVAFIFSTLDVVAAPGYSSVPFDVIAGVDLTGTITGAKIIFHREPYVLNDRIRQPLLDTYLARHAGYLIRGVNTGVLRPDFVAGASVTARSTRAAIYESARLVLRGRIDRPVVTEPTLDVIGFRPSSWERLLEQGSIMRGQFTNGDVAAAFAGAGGGAATPDIELGPDDETFAELFVGLATPAAVGRNLFRSNAYTRYIRQFLNGAHMIVVAANGSYSFLSRSHYKKANDYRLDRIQVVQNGKVFPFDRAHFQRLVAGGGNGLRAQQQAALFFIEDSTGFDPLQPWRAELLVHGALGHRGNHKWRGGAANYGFQVQTCRGRGQGHGQGHRVLL